MGQDPAHRPGPHLPALAGAAGGDAAGPGLRHQGGRRPGPQDRPRQSADAAQDSGFQSPGPSEPSGAHRQRDPPRRRLAQAVAAQRTPLEPRLAAARTLAGTQAQPGGHPSCALVAAVTYPCQPPHFSPSGKSLSSSPLILAVLAVLCLTVALTVHAQSQEVTPTSDATGENPPDKPTNLQASAEHDSVTLTWTASTDQTVTHYAILRRNRDTDATGVFHVIESNAGPEASYDDNSVSASSRYNYRVKAVSPTGVSQSSGYVKADTPAAPDPTPTPTPTPTSTPEPEPEPETDPADQAPTGLSAALAEGGGVALSWTPLWRTQIASLATRYCAPQARGRWPPWRPTPGAR